MTILIPAIFLLCALVNVPFMVYFGLHGEAWPALPSAVACGLNLGLLISVCMDRAIRRENW